MLKARILMVEDKAVRKAGELEPDLVLMDIRLKVRSTASRPPCASKGSISFLNPRASELLGCAPAAAAGRFFGQILQLVDRGTGTTATLPVSRVLLEGEGLSLPDSLLQVEGGGRLAVDVNLSPTRNAVGNVDGLVPTFRPVAGRRA